jgi:hypothetical protein
VVLVSENVPIVPIKHKKPQRGAMLARQHHPQNAQDMASRFGSETCNKISCRLRRRL